MAKYRLHLRYLYTFYNLGELVFSDCFDEYVELSEKETRFTLHDQENGSFTAGAVSKDHIGVSALLTFPGKEKILLHENDSAELIYDECYDAMGDENNNVYEGTVTLEAYDREN